MSDPRLERPARPRRARTSPLALSVRDDFAGPRLRTALLARYRDLAELRYDFPLVLAADDAGGARLQPLSEIVDGILQDIAPRGTAGERLRRQVLALEREIRALALDGAMGRLSQLWQVAEQNLLAQAGLAVQPTTLSDSFARARGALKLDGEIIDCDGKAPSRIVTHLWRVEQAATVTRLRARIERLILRLSEILKSDFMKSGEAHAPARLAHAFGGAFESAFDFEAMARIFNAAPHGARLPEARRSRIRDALNVLCTQKFAPCGSGIEPHAFAFDDCAAALAAYQKRLPEMAEIVKAMAIAELELDNRYREPVHDAWFARFDENALKPDELAQFPSCLVRVRDRGDGAGMAEIAEALASGLPLKVLLQCDDILLDRPASAGKFAFGRQGAQLAGLAIGLNSVFVVQACSSHLYAMRERVAAGLRYDGPALFSVFTGCTAGGCGAVAADLPPYLVAAAALESRAFPAFTYDPAAGADLAARFDIAGNPQAQAAWPVHRLDYEDEEHQSISENLAFTFADFVACDRRYTARFARVPRSRWQDGMAPVAKFLQDGKAKAQMPYTLLVDDSDVLQRCVPDDALIRATQRCLEAWHGLQELAGRGKPQVAHAPEPVPAAPPQAEAAQPAAAPPETAKETAAAPVQEAAAADVAYIETPRCTTCEECIQVNSRLFAYDDNKQAYITNPAAGTYRELVEAAERCQVSIIHPGKPLNPAEPGLEELLERAAPFQ